MLSNGTTFWTLMVKLLPRCQLVLNLAVEWTGGDCMHASVSSVVMLCVTPAPIYCLPSWLSIACGGQDPLGNENLRNFAELPRCPYYLDCTVQCPCSDLQKTCCCCLHCIGSKQMTQSGITRDSPASSLRAGYPEPCVYLKRLNYNESAIFSVDLGTTFLLVQKHQTCNTQFCHENCAQYLDILLLRCAVLIMSALHLI